MFLSRRERNVPTRAEPWEVREAPPHRKCRAAGSCIKRLGAERASVPSLTAAPTAAERHEQRQTAIAQLSTGKLWMMRAASSDRTPVQVWGLSDKYVYIAEGPAGSPYPSALVRLQIDKLDTINLP